jgi:hypothetical protein
MVLLGMGYLCFYNKLGQLIENKIKYCVDITQYFLTAHATFLTCFGYFFTPKSQ